MKLQFMDPVFVVRSPVEKTSPGTLLSGSCFWLAQLQSTYNSLLETARNCKALKLRLSIVAFCRSDQATGNLLHFEQSAAERNVLIRHE